MGALLLGLFGLWAGPGVWRQRRKDQRDSERQLCEHQSTLSAYAIVSRHPHITFFRQAARDFRNRPDSDLLPPPCVACGIEADISKPDRGGLRDIGGGSRPSHLGIAADAGGESGGGRAAAVEVLASDAPGRIVSPGIIVTRCACRRLVPRSRRRTNPHKTVVAVRRAAKKNRSLRSPGGVPSGTA